MSSSRLRGIFYDLPVIVEKQSGIRPPGRRNTIPKHQDVICDQMDVRQSHPILLANLCALFQVLKRLTKGKTKHLPICGEERVCGDLPASLPSRMGLDQ